MHWQPKAKVVVMIWRRPPRLVECQLAQVFYTGLNEPPLRSSSVTARPRESRQVSQAFQVCGSSGVKDGYRMTLGPKGGELVRHPAEIAGLLPDKRFKAWSRGSTCDMSSSRGGCR